MTTVSELARRGDLVFVEVDLDAGKLPKRAIYAHPRAVSWLDTTLPGLEPDGYFPGAAKPDQQADALFARFLAGEDESAFPPRCLSPTKRGVWELRTYDLRFFGWFWRRGIFVMSNASTKSLCLQIGYSGFRNEAVDTRDRLDLDPPSYLEGELHEVL